MKSALTALLNGFRVMEEFERLKALDRPFQVQNGRSPSTEGDYK